MTAWGGFPLTRALAHHVPDGHADDHDAHDADEDGVGAVGVVLVRGGLAEEQRRDDVCLLYTSPSPRDRG